MLRKKYTSYPWARYSKKLSVRIERPMHSGFYSKESATERGMRLAKEKLVVFKRGISFVYIFLSMKAMASLQMLNFRYMANQHSLELQTQYVSYLYERIMIKQDGLAPSLLIST